MLIDNGFAERLKWAIQSAGSNYSQLARDLTAIGHKLRAQSVQQWATGETTPKLDRIYATAQVLGVRGDWLAWGRGPMRATQAAPTAAAPSSVGEPHLAAHEWWARMIAALPPDTEPVLDQYVNSGPYKYRVDYQTGDIAAMVLLTPDDLTMPTLTTAARVRLWVLAVVHTLRPTLRPVLVVSPAEDSPPPGMPAYIEALQHEAQMLGAEVLYAGSPDEAARLLTGGVSEEHIPEIDLDVGSLV